MKASVNVANAKWTQKHNDRSLYKDHDSHNEFERAEHGENIHWDCYNMGSSFTSEAQWYKKTFSDTLKAQNERAIKTGHSERVMTMLEYHKKHMPKEMIIQLGSLDEPPMKNGKYDEDWIKEATEQTKDLLERCGLSVISYDIHYNEGTAHGHIRFAGVADGKMNMREALRRGGVLTPMEMACNKLDISPDVESCEKHREELQKIVPEMYTENKRTGETKFKASANSRLNTLTNRIVRDSLEDLAVDRGYEIDTVRQHRRNKNIARFKRDKENEKMSDVYEKQVEEIKQNQTLSYRQINKALNDAWDNFKDGDMKFQDPISGKEITGAEFIARNKELISNGKYRQSKKDKQLKALQEFEDKLDSIDKEFARPAPTVERLAHVQSEFDKQEAERKRVAEEQKRKQEEERKRAEAEARRKAEEEARQKAEAERQERERRRKELAERQANQSRNKGRGGFSR